MSRQDTAPRAPPLAAGGQLSRAIPVFRMFRMRREVAAERVSAEREGGPRATGLVRDGEGEAPAVAQAVLQLLREPPDPLLDAALTPPAAPAERAAPLVQRISLGN